MKHRTLLAFLATFTAFGLSPLSAARAAESAPALALLTYSGDQSALEARFKFSKFHSYPVMPLHDFHRKLVTQLPSKMRFVAAQFNALLHDDLWIRLAQHSNAMAARLYETTRDIPGVQYDRAPEVNSVFPCLPRAAIAPLAEWCFFWEWEPTRDQVRWMTSWDTTDRDIDRFAAGVRQLLAP